MWPVVAFMMVMMIVVMVMVMMVVAVMMMTGMTVITATQLHRLAGRDIRHRDRIRRI
jgi:uncharacterized membrane protein affecting hemolysin expression